MMLPENNMPPRAIAGPANRCKPKRGCRDTSNRASPLYTWRKEHQQTRYPKRQFKHLLCQEATRGAMYLQRSSKRSATRGGSLALCPSSFGVHVLQMHQQSHP